VTSDLREQLQATLGESFTLEQELGGGGMSRVFVATDSSLGRKVVVKVLPGDMAAEVRIDRFRREIQLAAHLQHPHIVPLLSAGDTNGLPYFIMPFVRGESLRERLKKIGEFPITEAVRILREVASALAYAHENGIVHRDIKPENILISGGSAMVTDFGVAKALRSATSGEPGSLTSIGVAIGTPAYMAPEQGTADPNTDHRADIYALGVVGYEMLAGLPPFSARSSQEMIAAHVTRIPDPVTVRRSTVPPVLARLIMSCLEKHPSDRPQNASEVMQQLDSIHISDSASTPARPRFGFGGKRSTERSEPRKDLRLGFEGDVIADVPQWRGRKVISAAGLAVIVVLVGTVFAWRHSLETNSTSGTVVGSAPPNSPPVRLAVLPFENLGGTDDAFVVDGVADEVRGKLASLPGLQVIARSSSGEYRQSSKSAQEIVRELGVRYLLTATVRTEEAAKGESKRLRVSPELIEVGATGTPVTIWQQGFDATFSDVFKMQSEVAERVAHALGVVLGTTERSRINEHPTENLAAYEAYRLGEQVSDGLSTYDTPTLRKAVRHYERAIALDSAFAAAWARLAEAQAFIYQSLPVADVAASARNAAQRAILLAPDRPEGRIALGAYYVVVEFDPSRGAEQFALGLKSAPNDPALLTAAGQVGWNLGQSENSLVYLRRAAAVDPRSVNTLQKLGEGLHRLRRYAEARDVIERALALAPDNVSTLVLRTMLELGRGDLPAARAVMRSAPIGVEPALAAYVSIQGDMAWALGDAARILILKSSPDLFGDDRGAWGLALAQLYSLRGDSTRARAYADSARVALAETLRGAPDDPQMAAMHGVALAYMGRRDEAVRDGKRGVALLPISKDAYIGPYIQHQLARIYVLVGEPEKALDQLEPLLKMPYFLSPGWLRIDPNFGPLRGNPRFERLAVSGK
jgi:serine/threonine protein kinase/tetratricopeptide (TPR) repeat protein